MEQPTPAWRSDKTTAASRGYGSRWQKARLHHLASHPLCVMCEAEGKVRAATVVDHKVPHKGDQALFWDPLNWQSLCRTCHNSDKKMIESSGKQRTKFDAAGRVLW